jgi:hypothetical protein
VTEREFPSEEELREALERVTVGDVILQTATAVASLGFQRVASEPRDLDQARLAIEALRALEPVLREGAVAPELVRDLEQARANLQLAYAAAVSEAAKAEAHEPAEPPSPEETSSADESATADEPEEAVAPEEESDSGEALT